SDNWKLMGRMGSYRDRPSGLAHRRDPLSQAALELDDRVMQLGHNRGHTRNSNRTSSSNLPTRCSPRRRWETSRLTPETAFPPAPFALSPRETRLHSPENSPDLMRFPPENGCRPTAPPPHVSPSTGDRLRLHSAMPYPSHRAGY